MTIEFAFEADNQPLGAVPLDVAHLDADRALPGLNVLAWVKGRLSDGTPCAGAIRLYLVKRGETWKIFQFSALPKGADPTSSGINR